MDLTFQVPMQYCCLQHWILLLSPVTSTAGYCFCFGSIPSFFLELFLHWSPVAYWAPNDLGSSSFGILSFAFSYCSWGSQGKNTEVACHSLLQWTTFCQTSPPWRDGTKCHARPFRYDLNQIPYDYTVEVRDRFKGLGLIDRVPDELWNEVRDIVQETGIKTIPMEKKWKKKQNGCLGRLYK